MTRAPATRIQRVQPPATLAAGEKARQLARQGHDVIDLGQSSPPNWIKSRTFTTRFRLELG